MKLENNGKALPILSFPCTSLMGVKTDELVHQDSKKTLDGLHLIFVELPKFRPGAC